MKKITTSRASGPFLSKDSIDKRLKLMSLTTRHLTNVTGGGVIEHSAGTTDCEGPSTK
jgi:hypothetical protein